MRTSDLTDMTMHGLTALPIVIAVSGHRDLIDQDLPGIKDAVHQKLLDIKNTAAGVPIILLSGLAKGADQLVAELALGLGLNVVAVLPMPKDDFLEDFQDEAERQYFENLYQSCHSHIELPWHEGPVDNDISAPRDQQYRNQSIFIVRQAQLVLALWDGQPAKALGACGTSYVVKLCREGPPPVSGEFLIAPETTSLIQIPVRRASHHGEMVNHAKPVESDLTYKRVIQEFKIFNQLNPQASLISDSRRWILPGSNSDYDEGTNALLGIYSRADAMSLEMQRLRNKAVLIASVAVVMGAFSQSFYSYSNNNLFLIGYGALLIAAYAIYILLFRWKKSRVEDRYLEYRVLAEGLRVQVFWRLCGIRKNAAEYYLQLIKNEVGWVREALRNMAFLADVASDARTDLSLLIDHWIKDQEKYFSGDGDKWGKSSAQNQIQIRLDRFATFAFLAGATLIGVTGLSYFYSIDPAIKQVASAFSGSFMLLAGVIKGYSLVMGYQEQVARYDKCGQLFRYAREAIEKSPNPEHTSACLFELGKQALQENADWFLQHRRNSFEIQS